MILGPDGRPLRQLKLPDTPAGPKLGTIGAELAKLTPKDRRAYIRDVAEMNVKSKFPTLSRSARRIMAHKLAKDPYFKKAVLDATTG